MSDYALVRTRSALALSSCAPIGLTRTYSVPDLYRPSFSSYYYYPYYTGSRYWYPYRYLTDSYYNYSWPYTYRSYYSYPYSRYYYPYGYYGYYPYSYYSRYRSYLDYSLPYYSRRWYDPYYDSYLGSYRYRSWLLDSMEDGLHKGLALYRNGTISFTQLNRNWISTTSWFQRHKDWRLLYLWDKNLSNPDSHKPEIRDYKAEWVPAFNPT